MLNEVEVKKWRTWLTNEATRLKEKGYGNSKIHQRYIDQVGILDLIVSNEKLEDVNHEL